MELKNIIAAVTLSIAIIVLYSLFFQPTPEEIAKLKTEREKGELIKNSDTPSLDENTSIKKLSRKDALNENKRIYFENENISGSISLKGGIIDDLMFKNYRISLDKNKKVILLNPRNIENGYFIESGFVTNSKNIQVPNSKSIWSIEGNEKLTNNNPVKLTWKNNEGIIFEKEIELDDQFLFTIKEKVFNKTNKTYNFYSYGQIIRNKKPEISGFYILHEGPIATLDDQLIEEDYDDLVDEKFVKNSSKGWLGIGDKYWITSIVPPRNKEFKTTFDYKNKFRVNYISREGIEAGPNDTIEEDQRDIL